MHWIPVVWLRAVCLLIPVSGLQLKTVQYLKILMFWSNCSELRSYFIGRPFRISEIISSYDLNMQHNSSLCYSCYVTCVAQPCLIYRSGISQDYTLWNSTFCNLRCTTWWKTSWRLRFSRRRVRWLSCGIARRSVVHSDRRFKSPYCVHHQRDDRGSMPLWNVDRYLRDCRVARSRRQTDIFKSALLVVSTVIPHYSMLREWGRCSLFILRNAVITKNSVVPVFCCPCV
jgi:hypothetical protein